MYIKNSKVATEKCKKRGIIDMLQEEKKSNHKMFDENQRQ